MRTAVIYSGQARTFKQVFRNQYWHVLRKLPNPEFFVSVDDDAQADDMLKLLERFPVGHVHFEKAKQIGIVEPPEDAPYDNIYPCSVPVQSVLRQLRALQTAWWFFIKTARPTDFDMVVRIRPDLAFGRFEMPRLNSARCYTPYWSRWGGVNDRLVVMRPDAAEAYFTTFSKIPLLRSLGCPLHPEQMILASLQLAHVPVSHTLAADFITVRLDGSFVPMQITEIDKLEYARTKP